jgi:hypothetical protein
MGIEASPVKAHGRGGHFRFSPREGNASMNQKTLIRENEKPLVFRHGEMSLRTKTATNYSFNGKLGGKSGVNS